jgi:hypothetical protein
MPHGEILHICLLDKFIPPFIEFIKENFEFERHTFHLSGDIDKYSVTKGTNVLLFMGTGRLFKLLHAMYRAKRIILHGLFDPKIVELLALQPWLLKKCYWVMWGGDLYHYKFRERNKNDDRHERIRAFVIKRVGHLVTYIKGDYELAQKWYGATGVYHECLMYPSNLYKESPTRSESDSYLNVLVGNSAEPSNNHLKVFDSLKPLMHEGVRIYCPLSYGDSDYAAQIASKGKQLFGEQFTALLDFIPIEKYLELLGKIDIAIFAHKRQQGMGNTITLLGNGKKVFIRSDVTPWKLFTSLGVHIFDANSIEISEEKISNLSNNTKVISEYFSTANLVKQYNNLFY